MIIFISLFGNNVFCWSRFYDLDCCNWPEFKKIWLLDQYDYLDLEYKFMGLFIITKSCLVYTFSELGKFSTFYHVRKYAIISKEKNRHDK